MKSFYSAQEIEDLARQGVRELLVDDNVVLTDLARQTAGQLGVRLVTSKPNTASNAPASAPGSAAPKASAPLPAKPRGCQHGTTGPKAPASGPGATTGAQSQVMDDLVGLVKQMSKR